MFAEELSGIFVKSISEGSAANLCKKIQVNDRIVEVCKRELSLLYFLNSLWLLVEKKSRVCWVWFLMAGLWRLQSYELEDFTVHSPVFWGLYLQGRRVGQAKNHQKQVASWALLATCLKMRSPEELIYLKRCTVYDMQYIDYEYVLWCLAHDG